MSNFDKFNKKMKAQFAKMIEGKDILFLTDVEKDWMWETYLDSFPEGTNEVFKERREFDCNACRHFIRPYGNVVAINADNTISSIWDIEDAEYPFNVVTEKMSKLVKSANIRDVFVTDEVNLGVEKNKQLLEGGEVCTWEHLSFKLPSKFKMSITTSPEAIQGKYRDAKNVFKRSMEELSIDAGITVLELIEQGSLYRGEEHKKNVEVFIKYKKDYDKVVSKKKDVWCWNNSMNNPVAKIRNTALGTLLIDLSDGVELDTAVTKFEKVMAPSNYKRPKAIFTKKMVEEAEKKIAELGFENSLERRHAVLEDITVNNVLFVNNDSKKKLGGSVFDDLKDEVVVNPKSFNKVEEVSAEDFVKNILPKATNIELMVENRHRGNFMNLIAPKNADAPSMLKWNNNFSWSYNGDMADSMKQNVKKAGGNVEGVLRFSIQWNDKYDNNNDFDAHCYEPGGNHIYFGSRTNAKTTGELDVDIQRPGSKVAVENITWTDINKMREGKYQFSVHNFSHRGGRSGFSAEIEYDGQIYSFVYDKELRNNETIEVATIEFSRANGIKFVKSLDSSVSSTNIYGIPTNQFVKVNVCMFSPNYWDEQKGIGNKHYFFFLEGCKSESSPRGFYNEHLNDKLMEHKRVFEALGSRMRVADSDTEMAGLGFSTTQRNSVIAKVEGSFKRTVKINF